MYYVVIMSYYNQPLLDDWARPSQIQKWCKPNTKLAQAIFLPGAWGKIPVFMGKNHPTPGAAMAFLHALNYPHFARLKKFLKNF